MKAYKIQATYSDTIVFVGQRSHVQQELTNLFHRLSSQQNAQRFQSRSMGDLPIKTNPQQKLLSRSLLIHPWQVSKGLIQSQFCQNSEPKHLSVHLLLFGLPITQYNDFQASLNQKFSNQLLRNSNPISLHVMMVESREEYLKYIKKIDKFNSAEFQSSYQSLCEDLESEMEYQLIKNYMSEKFDYTREEVFEWTKATGVKTLQELLTCKVLPGYQKKEIREMLTNLTLLEELQQ